MAATGDSGRKAKGLHDRFYARAVCFPTASAPRPGRARLDRLFHEDVGSDPAQPGPRPAPQALVIAATHTHSGPDTLGLWGPVQGVLGRRQGVPQRIHETVARLVKRFVSGLQEAELYSSVRPIEIKGRCWTCAIPS